MGKSDKNIFPDAEREAGGVKEQGVWRR